MNANEETKQNSSDRFVHGQFMNIQDLAVHVLKHAYVAVTQSPAVLIQVLSKAEFTSIYSLLPTVH